MTFSNSALKRPSRRARAGFTLIELLVVVVIIGILASVALPSFVGAQDRARNSAAVSTLNVVRQGLEQFAADNRGSYPGNATMMTATGLLTNAYMPGNRLPKSPWSATSQAVRIQPTVMPLMCVEWLDDPATYPPPQPGAKFSPALLGTVGNPPTLVSHYGAISSDLEDSNANAQRTRYVLNVTGKKGKNIVNAGWVTNGGR